MAKGKLILICQSGGEFVTNDDGTMSYNGGEANAANVTSETPFNDLKLNLAETCNFDQETVTVKYFLPGNKRNLITVKNDKDVKRMIDFHGDALTAEVFVTGTPGFTRAKIEEPVKDDNTSTKNDDVAKEGKVGPKKDKKVKKDKDVPNTPTTKRTRRAAKTEASSNENEEKIEPLESDNAKSDGSTGDTSTSVGSEHVNIKEDSGCSSDFVPSRYPKRKKRNKNETDIISEASPADSVKKRRRTPSWKFGANGRPTIVSDPDASVGPKSQRKSGRLAAKVGETKSGKKRGRPRAVKVLASTSDDQENDDSAPHESLVSGVELNKEKEKDKLHELDKDSYNKLPWFCNKIIETNPGSISKLMIGDNKRFKALFVSFYASLSGFQNSCRPLLFLESTSFRSKYGEFILTANAIDGNDGFFPVSFAIVDVEDDDNWRWFLEQLKDSILITQPITFVFDREKNLKKLVLEIFQGSHIGYSIYHLLESFKRTVKGPFHGDGKSFLPVHFLAAAHAVRVGGFRKSTEQIKLISQQAYDWVMQIEPQHWTTSSFQGERYNHITDDINFSLSKLMNDYHELPILKKVDALIRSMIDEITDAKLDATMWGTHLTPSKEKQLQEENLKSCGLKVLISSDTLFEVREDSTHVVNLGTWSCTCLGWKETGLPCRHALAVFALIGKNPYEFCSNYFTVDAYRITYAESINPVPIEKEEECKMIEMTSTGGEDENNEKIEVEKEKDENIEVVEEKEEALGSKEEWAKVEDEKEKGENVEIAKGGGENEEVEKDEGEKGNNKIDEDEVVVLPPIPVKPADVANEKIEWEETEVETKRTVTCTKCKQPGHNKKSCNLYQLQQAC